MKLGLVVLSIWTQQWQLLSEAQTGTPAPVFSSGSASLCSLNGINQVLREIPAEPHLVPSTIQGGLEPTPCAWLHVPREEALL